jgi:hypothetical protein
VTYRPAAGRGLEANNGTVAYTVQRRGKHASTTMELLLGKYVPAQLLRMQLKKRGVVYAVRAEELYKKEKLCN